MLPVRKHAEHDQSTHGNRDGHLGAFIATKDAHGLEVRLIVGPDKDAATVRAIHIGPSTSPTSEFRVHHWPSARDMRMGTNATLVGRTEDPVEAERMAREAVKA